MIRIKNPKAQLRWIANHKWLKDSLGYIIIIVTKIAIMGFLPLASCLRMRVGLAFHFAA